MSALSTPEAATTWAGFAAAAAALQLQRFIQTHTGKTCSICNSPVTEATSIWFGDPPAGTITCPSCHGKK